MPLGHAHFTVMANGFAETPSFMLEGNFENDASGWIFISPDAIGRHGIREKAG